MSWAAYTQMLRTTVWRFDDRHPQVTFRTRIFTAGNAAVACITRSNRKVFDVSGSGWLSHDPDDRWKIEDSRFILIHSRTHYLQGVVADNGSSIEFDTGCCRFESKQKISNKPINDTASVRGVFKNYWDFVFDKYLNYFARYLKIISVKIRKQYAILPAR